MPPFHIQHEDDYVLWIEKFIKDAGGWIQGILEYELVELGPGEYYGFIIRRTRVEFGDGCVLGFNMHVDGELESRKYEFDFRTPTGELIWRKDMHPGHEDLGGLEHIHRGVEGEVNPEKFDQVEIDEVFQEITEFQKDGSLP